MTDIGDYARENELKVRIGQDGKIEGFEYDTTIEGADLEDDEIAVLWKEADWQEWLSENTVDDGADILTDFDGIEEVENDKKARERELLIMKHKSN